jgi:hypothetical protein
MEIQKGIREIDTHEEYEELGAANQDHAVAADAEDMQQRLKGLELHCEGANLSFFQRQQVQKKCCRKDQVGDFL